MKTSMRSALTRRDESGATAVEYALLVSLIAAVIISVVALVGQDLVAIFTDANSWPWG